MIFPILAQFPLSETGQIYGFHAFSAEHKEGMAWNLTCRCILSMHLNWSDYGHGLSVFLIVAQFWLSGMGKICGFRAFSGGHIEGSAQNLPYWCILINSQNLFIYGQRQLIFLFLAQFLLKTGKMCSFWAFSGIQHADVSWPPAGLVRFLSWCVDSTYFCHVYSIALCLSDWSFAAKGCHNYLIPRSTCEIYIVINVVNKQSFSSKCYSTVSRVQCVDSWSFLKMNICGVFISFKRYINASRSSVLLHSLVLTFVLILSAQWSACFITFFWMGDYQCMDIDVF